MSRAKSAEHFAERFADAVPKADRATGRPRRRTDHDGGRAAAPRPALGVATVRAGLARTREQSAAAAVGSAVVSEESSAEISPEEVSVEIPLEEERHLTRVLQSLAAYVGPCLGPARPGR